VTLIANWYSKEVDVSKYAPEPISQQQKDDLQDLTMGWMDLPEKDHTFAQSLLFQWDTKQWLSGKQWYWVGQMASKLPDRQVPDFTKGLKDELDELESLRGGKAPLATTQIS
jgi:hypothetical protein